jgi:heat shock protein HslJ
MRIARLPAGLILVLLGICLQAQPAEQKITVTGKLVRAMAIGGESTGWALELESATSMAGKQVTSIQVSYRKTGKLEKLENKRVTATGKLAHRQGVETGEQPVLEVSSIEELKGTAQATPAKPVSFSLSNSEWLLEDLGGSGVLDNIQATLAFQDAGKAVGNGSCNRFFGSAEINGDAIKLGPLASSRMACPEAVMNQETKYLKALQAADRFERKDPYLLIYCKGLEKPLRFTMGLSAATNSSSCRETAGPERAKTLVEQCMQVSPATHPPCNAQNSCSLIVEEIRRGCGLLKENPPGFCTEYK